MRNKKARIIVAIAAAVIIFYIVFLPSPTAQWAVRKDLALQLHPVQAFGDYVHEGNIKNDPQYGDLYYVDDVSLAYVYVRKNALGWRVTSRGTGP